MTAIELPSSSLESGPGWLDIPHLARMLAVSENFIRRLVSERRIPFYKVGKFIRFDPDEVMRWLADKRVDQLH